MLSPTTITWGHCQAVFDSGSFMRALLNSTIVSFRHGAPGTAVQARLPLRDQSPQIPGPDADSLLDSFDDDVPGDRDRWLVVHLPAAVQLAPEDSSSSALTFSLPFIVWVLSNFFARYHRVGTGDSR